MLETIHSCFTTIKKISYPLHPIKSVSQIAFGAVSLLSTPFTGSIGFVNGLTGLSQGAVNGTKDLIEAGHTVSHIIKADSINGSQLAHLTVSVTVVSAVAFSVLNPLGALAAAKIGTVAVIKPLLISLCLI